MARVEFGGAGAPAFQKRGVLRVVGEVHELVGSRYSIRDIVVAITEPSDTISEQYQARKVILEDGTKLFGRLIRTGEERIELATNPYNISDVTEVPMEKVESMAFSQVSMMPPGTLTLMNAGEVADLVAYLISGGDRGHEVFQAE